MSVLDLENYPELSLSSEAARQSDQSSRTAFEAMKEEYGKDLYNLNYVICESCGNINTLGRRKCLRCRKSLMAIAAEDDFGTTDKDGFPIMEVPPEVAAALMDIDDPPVRSMMGRFCSPELCLSAPEHCVCARPVEEPTALQAEWQGGSAPREEEEEKKKKKKKKKKKRKAEAPLRRSKRFKKSF